MVSRVFSAGLSGIDGYIVTVECFLSGGLPRLDVVGLPTGAVSEAGERVRAAAKACAFDWPVSRLTVNLAPADTKKAGTAYDLPILLSILAAAGEIDAPPDNALFFGELSLTGELRPVCGALSMALAARDAGFKTVFVPAMNAAEASYASGVTVFPIHTLNELLGHLNGRKPLTPCAPPPKPEPQDDALDFAHVLGQHAVKRALEIAAAGGHNVLLSGPPGSGKSMAAKRFSTILPPLSDSERLEVIRVWSAIGVGNLSKAEKVLAHTDLVLCDLKFLTKADYLKNCRADFDQIERFLQLTAMKNVPLWIRHVVVPGLTDGMDHLRRVKAKAESYPNFEKLEFLPFHKLCMEKYERLGLEFPLKDTPAMNPDALKTMVAQL